MSDNGVIGDRGGLPWRIPDDMKRFKRLTLGKPIIMGRKTWDSFPKKPLPGRTNIVVTHDTSWRAEGAVAVHSFDAALTMARTKILPRLPLLAAPRSTGRLCPSPTGSS